MNFCATLSANYYCDKSIKQKHLHWVNHCVNLLTIGSIMLDQMININIENHFICNQLQLVNEKKIQTPINEFQTPKLLIQWMVSRRMGSLVRKNVWLIPLNTSQFSNHTFKEKAKFSIRSCGTLYCLRSLSWGRKVGHTDVSSSIAYYCYQ